MSPANVEVETVTLGEVNRNVNRLADQVTLLSTAVADYPKWPDVKRVEDGLSRRIASLEAWVKWAGRSIIGAVIVSGVGALIVTR